MTIISEETNVSWKGDIWIDDNWTAEDKAKAMEELHALEHQQHTNDKQQHQQRQEVFDQFRRNASTNWNSFYDKNQTNFFKDRHYLHKAFPAEFGWLYVDSNACEEDKNNSHQHHSILDNNITVAEIGCGVGNAILPLLEQHTELIHKKQTRSSDDDNVRIPQLQIHCLDFAPTAIHLLKLDPRFQSAAKEGRATAHVYDLSSTHPSQVNLENTADVAILLFCLSAIGPHPSAALSRASRHVIDILKPGGTLVIRDYGRLDEAQMKLSRGEKKIDENFYRKGDGTGCYYFELQDLKDLFVNDQDGDEDNAKLELLELEYIQRVYRNRGDNSTRRRVWIQGRFCKPVATPKEKDNITRPLPNGSIDNYSATAGVRWENYYKALATSKSSSLRVPTNLFQIFPTEFSPWQSLMKQHRRENHRRGNEQNIQPSYHDGGISDCVTIVDLGCGLAANSSLLDLTYTLQKQQQQNPDKENKIPRVKVHFLDISAAAIKQFCDDERYKSGLAHGSVASHIHDIRQPWTLDESADKRFDLVLLLFTLSTIGPCNCEDMKQTIINAVNMLREGGVLLFRDYGRYDDDQLQLNSIPGAQLHNNFYLRDGSSELLGTGCYFFDLDEVRELFVGTGLEVLQLEYTTRTYKKTGKSSKDLSKNGGAAERKRIFVDGRFRKP